MEDAQKVKIAKTVAFVTNVISGMSEIFATMPEGMTDYFFEEAYDMSLREFAVMFSEMASFPVDDNQYDFENLFS